MSGLFQGLKRAAAPAQPPAPHPVPYFDVREGIDEGDVLLFRSSGWVSAAIRRFGRSRYSHAALMVKHRLHDGSVRLLAVEFRELRGARLVLLSEAVKGAEVDLYKVREAVLAPGMRDRVADIALGILWRAMPYGYGTILRLALSRLPGFLVRKIPVLRRFAPATCWPDDDLADPREYVCSTFVAHAWRLAGLDLVEGLADDATEPGDLPRGGKLYFAGTLKPDGGWGVGPSDTFLLPVQRFPGNTPGQE